MQWAMIGSYWLLDKSGTAPPTHIQGAAGGVPAVGGGTRQVAPQTC